jgi:putative ABC transport system permease protein
MPATTLPGVETLPRRAPAAVPVFLLAWKNLVQDRARLAVALVGITFAVFLMLAQSGIYLGFVGASSAVIDHSSADLWIVPSNTLNFESSALFTEDDLAAVRGTPGIARADSVVHAFGYVKLPDGGGTWAQIVGFPPESPLVGPWDLAEGKRSDLRRPSTYIVDASSLAQLGGVRVGDKLENMDRKLEVVGICRGARTQTSYPFLFTSLRTAQEMPSVRDRVNFVVARLARPSDLGPVRERLRRLGRFDVLTREELSARTHDYWTTRTGIGIGIGLTTVLGFLVGLVIAGQTLYASTLDRLREFATLKALGATNAEVSLVIAVQAVLLGLAGYALGSVLVALADAASAGRIVSLRLTAGLFLGIFGAAMTLCLGASLLSVARVLRVAPSEVFRS